MVRRRTMAWVLAGLVGSLVAAVAWVAWQDTDGPPPNLKVLAGVRPVWERPSIERPNLIRTGTTAYWVPKPLAEVEAEVAEQVLTMPGWLKANPQWGITYLRGKRPGTLYRPTVRLMKGRVQRDLKQLDRASSGQWTTVIVGDHLRSPRLLDRVRALARRVLP